MGPPGPPGSGGSWSFSFAVSDEITPLTTGDSKITFFMPENVTVTEIFTGVSDRSTLGNVTIDLRKNGTTVFTTPPSIEPNEDTSLTGIPAVLATTAFAKGDKIEVDISGAGNNATGLKVVMIGSTGGA